MSTPCAASSAGSRGEVRRLEEDKGELEQRIAHLQREMEQMRAKVPRGISTS